MIHEPSNIDHAEALRLLAQFIDDARHNGAKAMASIHSHGVGLHNLTLSFDEEPRPAEIAAWQLASRAVWAVDEIVLSESRQVRSAFVTYRGLRLRINLSYPAGLSAVAA